MKCFTEAVCGYTRLMRIKSSMSVLTITFGLEHELLQLKVKPVTVLIITGSFSWDCGKAKFSERIILQHLYHVTFFRNVISDAFRIKFRKLRMHFGHFSELYPKCIPNASEIYQKSIPNSNKNTIFLQNKPTIRPETNQISSIHCNK